MSLVQFSDWLYATPISSFIRDAGWIIPAAQSIHIVAIAVLMGSGIVLNLKLVGLLAKTESARAVFQRYMPWLWSALVVLLSTGVVLTTAEPNRELTNWVFWTKMVLVLIGFFSTLVIRIPMQRDELAGGASAWRFAVKPLGLLSLSIWVVIIVCGRWIAYA